MMNKPMLLFLTLLSLACGRVPAQHEVRKPNILFAIMDDATYLHMGAYGCSWINTPNFDRIAKNGLLFRNAYTPNAKCAPSRSVILTGRNSWQLEAAANHWPFFPEKFRVFTEVLSENGYHVGYTGKGWAPGIAKNKDGSKRNLLIKAWNQSRTTPPTNGISAIDYAGNFDRFLAKRNDMPFFFWYGGLEPHRGYEYASGIKKGGKSLDQLSDEQTFAFWPATDSVKTDLLDYAYEIEYFDRQLGKMIDALERSGELENTIIVVTSDNGMPFPRVKGQAYEYSNHLPLAIMWPGGIKHPGRTIDDFISFTDLAPTFLEVAGIPAKQSGMQKITGNSIRDIFDSPEEGFIDPHRNFVLVGKERHDVGRPEDQGYPIRGIVRDSMLYLRNFKPKRWPSGNPETGYLNTDGGATKTFLLKYAYSSQSDHQYWEWNFGKRPPEELYNIKNDPDCLKNLAGEESLQQLKNELNAFLSDRLKQEQDPRILGHGDIFDQYEYANPKTAHFYERYLNKDTTLSWGWVNDSDFQIIP
ncbi:MAG TPA: sulfatase [Anseongella sp.]